MRSPSNLKLCLRDFARARISADGIAMKIAWREPAVASRLTVTIVGDALQATAPAKKIIAKASQRPPPVTGIRLRGGWGRRRS